MDENNQYLIEKYHITYLTSGRDLLRLKDKFALEMIKSEERSHPFYWASFIPSGDWTPMEFDSVK